MKKLAILLFAPLVFSCASYEKVTLVDETPLYENIRPEEQKIATIPANTEVMMAGNGKYRKVKYKKQKGYVLQPNYATHTVVKKTVPTP